MTRREIEIFERDLRKVTSDLINTKPKPAEIPKPTDFKNLKMEPVNMETKKTSLTWKSVVVIILVAVAHAVLSLFFDAETTNKLIEVLKTILEAIGITAIGTAAWGIRRAI